MHIESAFRTWLWLDICSFRAKKPWRANNICCILMRAEVSRRTGPNAVCHFRSLRTDKPFKAIWYCRVIVFTRLSRVQWLATSAVSADVAMICVVRYKAVKERLVSCCARSTVVPWRAFCSCWCQFLNVADVSCWTLSWLYHRKSLAIGSLNTWKAPLRHEFRIKVADRTWTLVCKVSPSCAIETLWTVLNLKVNAKVPVGTSIDYWERSTAHTHRFLVSLEADSYVDLCFSEFSEVWG